jgi:hypothetical protein
LDTGALGAATVSIDRTSDVHRLVDLEAAGHPERSSGRCQWTTRSREVRGPPSVAVAVDGEARTWEPPLRFMIRPNTLPVSIALGQSGASPALLHTPVAVSTLVGLGRVVRGRPSAIVPHHTSGEA